MTHILSFSRMQPPPLYQATLGLSKTYTLVRESRDKIRPRAWSASTTETRLYTSDDGSLRLGPHLPLLMGRYRFIRLIGQGTFAQIICAEDTYHPSRRQVCAGDMCKSMKNLSIQKPLFGRPRAMMAVQWYTKTVPNCPVTYGDNII